MNDARALVLNVNDAVAARYVVTKMLRIAGFDVEDAVDGESALERLVLAPQPDIVVLDVHLPRMSGFEVSRAIRANAHTRHIKVLQTSATFVSLNSKIEGLEAGADAYLTQPFEAAELVAIVRSLARLSKTERELRVRGEKLSDADKKKDEFLAMLAHELRNPLSALTNALALQANLPPRDETEEKTRAVMQRQTQHLTRLVNDLLDVSRVTRARVELKVRPMDLRGLLLDVAGRLKRQLFDVRGQILDVDIADKPIWIDGDVDRLEQVFVNLLDNASKYTDSGGRIRLAVALEQDRVEISVKDSGVGISAEALPTIFELFMQSGYSLARSRGGLGIGLTLAKTLLGMHKGDISARSDGLGKGSEMLVHLPLRKAVSVAESPSRALPRMGKKRILLVEDNDDARELMQLMLEQWGHEVFTAADGRLGLEAMRTLDRIDLALVDIGLPELDGYEVARRVCEAPEHRPKRLVALTGYGSSAEKKAALEAGFDLHLVKPVDPRSLAELIAQPSAQERAPPSP